MSRRRLLDKRLLLGMRTRGLARAALLDIVTGMRMPEKFQSPFFAELPQADVVLFGIEDSEAGPVYKAYLEFWEKVRDQVRVTGTKEPALLNLGFKWSARDDTVSVVSRYTCFPMLDLAGTLRRIRGLYGEATDRPSCRVALHLAELAARRKAASIYMEVGEEGTPRRSYDINFYKANLTLAAIEPALREAAAQYALPHEAFDALLSRVRARPLGHLSGGVARDGGDFLTVYYEMQPL